MEKIKDLKKVILTEGSILVEIIEPKRIILRPDGSTDKDSYAKVILAGPNVTDIEEGDLIIKYSGNVYGYTMKTKIDDKERTIAIMHRGAVTVAVKSDNFIDPDKLAAKVVV